MNKNQKFEVYTHSNIHTGIPFYVGSGVIGRAKETRNRNLDWGKEIDLLGNAYDINIIATYDNIDDARKHEDQLIRFFGLRKDGGVLTNQRYFTKGGTKDCTWSWTPEQCAKHSQLNSGTNNPMSRGGVIVKDLITGEATIYISKADCAAKLTQLGLSISHMSVHNYCVYNDNAESDTIVCYKKYPHLAFYYYDTYKERFITEFE